MKILNLILFFGTFQIVTAQTQTSKDDIFSIESNLTNRIKEEGTTAKSYTIEERIQEYTVPGVSIAIAREGELVYAKGFGLANSKEKTQVDEHTLFQAASISKPLAALAVLKLVDQGKLDLDENVNAYLTSWKVPENRFTQKEKVTLRRILSHTAGLTVHGFPGYKPKADLPSTAEVLLGNGNTSAVTVDTIPGSIWRYSGGGYTVMQQVVEDVTGMFFSDYMDQHILPELGMTESTFQQPISEDKSKLASGAYNSNGKLFNEVWHNYPEIAAAGLWTTPSDLIKYCLYMQKSVQEPDGKMLSEKMIKTMLSPGMNGWGLGPRLGKLNGEMMFGHDGKNLGFTTMMKAFVNHGDAIVIMTNGDGGMKLIEEIERAVSDFYGWNMSQSMTLKTIELKEKDLRKFVGNYKYQFGDDKGVVKVKMKKGVLRLKDSGMNERLYLKPLKELEFIDLSEGIMIDFSVDDNGKVTGLLWNKQWEIKKMK